MHTALAKRLMKYGKSGDVYVVATRTSRLDYTRKGGTSYTLSFYDSPPKGYMSWKVRASTVKTMAGATKVAKYLIAEYS